MEREQAREREQAEAAAAQAEFEEGLRRRGARVYHPEPDLEPNPRPPPAPQTQGPQLGDDQAPAPEPPEPQAQGPQPLLGPELAAEARQPQPRGPQPAHEETPAPEPPAVLQYVDDAAVIASDEPAVVPREQLGYVHANRLPPRPQDGEGGGNRPNVPVIRQRVDIIRELQRQQREERALDLPPNPSLILNPEWGPPEPQPTIRWLRANSNNWGDLQSALHQAPPVHIRRDVYQFDEVRGVLIRWHTQARVRLFTPEVSRLPRPLEQAALTGRRRSFIIELHRRFWIEDNFRDPRPQRTLEAEWRGRTELEVDRAFLQRIRAPA